MRSLVATDSVQPPESARTFSQLPVSKCGTSTKRRNFIPRLCRLPQGKTFRHTLVEAFVECEVSRVLKPISRASDDRRALRDCRCFVAGSNCQTGHPQGGPAGSDDRPCGINWSASSARVARP